jgi:hypothetical protein
MQLAVTLMFFLIEQLLKERNINIDTLNVSSMFYRITGINRTCNLA